MNNLYKHKSGLTVDVIAIANSTATDGRQILIVYQVLKSGEVFTETAMQFTEEGKEEWQIVDTQTIN